ncbi:MAG: extracellular solute-binding protein [Lachnospirales bacterium]
MKKLKALCLATIMLFAFGCGTVKPEDIGANANNTAANSDTTSETAEETVTVKFVGPGTAHEDQPRITKEINKKLLADGLNIQFDPTFIAWDAWDQKINMMLSTGEEFDLLHVMENGVPTGSYVGRGALKPLNEHLAKVPSLQEKIKDYEWDAVTVNGKIYSVPNVWTNAMDMNGETGTVTIRTDILDKLDLPLPEDGNEIMEALKAQKEYWGDSVNIYAWDHEINRTPVWLHRTYDTWPFYVNFNNPLIYVNELGEVKSWLETEEFKMDAEYYRELYINGLINPDVLSLPVDERTKAGEFGDFLAGLGSFNLVSQAGYNDKGLDATVEDFFLNPNSGQYVFMPVLNSNAVPVTAENPKEALEFLDWAYGSEKNMSLLNLGEEGIDYNSVGDGRFEYIKDSANPDAPTYQFPTWQIGYLPNMLIDVNQTDEYVERLKAEPKNYQLSIVTGFTFDPTPVQAEYANCVAQLATTIYPIRFGVVEYEEAYPDAIAKMKTAGLDIVIAEYERQFNKFLTEKE